MEQDVPLIALQMLIRTLSFQLDDRSWCHSSEITAYALITLKRLDDLLWWEPAGLQHHLRNCVRRAVEFLDQTSVTSAFIWVEKVTYDSSVLAEAYCLAAYRLASAEGCHEQAHNWGARVWRRRYHRPRGSTAFWLSSLACRSSARSRNGACDLRSWGDTYLILPRLRRHVKQINIPPQWPAQDGQKPSSYFEYIPLTWTASNNAAAFGISTGTIFDMSVILVLNFQVDKCLEQVTEDPRVLSLGSKGFRKLKDVVQSLNHVNHHAESCESGEGVELSLVLKEFRKTLLRFVAYVSGHPHISHAVRASRQRLEYQLDVFLEAHLTHGEHNAQMRHYVTAPGRDKIFTGANGGGYYEWVRTTSADHTSCPYSFEFFNCLVSRPSRGGKLGYKTHKRQDGLSLTPQSWYFASDICRQLATLCRHEIN